MFKFLAFASFIICSIKLSDGIRCFECRSDVLRACGDPFFPGNVPARECSQLSVNPTFMCFKASQYVGGTFVTVRGCAPFDTESFSPGMQRAMSGTFWKGFNIFAMCDYDNCNTATTGTQAKTGLLSFSIFMILIIQYFSYGF